MNVRGDGSTVRYSVEAHRDIRGACIEVDRTRHQARDGDPGRPPKPADQPLVRWVALAHRRRPQRDPEVPVMGRHGPVEPLHRSGRRRQPRRSGRGGGPGRRGGLPRRARRGGLRGGAWCRRRARGRRGRGRRSDSRGRSQRRCRRGRWRGRWRGRRRDGELRRARRVRDEPAGSAAERAAHQRHGDQRKWHQCGEEHARGSSLARVVPAWAARRPLPRRAVTGRTTRDGRRSHGRERPRVGHDPRIRPGQGGGGERGAFRHGVTRGRRPGRRPP